MNVERAIYWMGAGQLITLASQLVANAVASRLLTPVEIGVYVAATAIVGILTAVQVMGLNALVVSYKENDSRFLDSVFSVSLMLGVAASMLLGTIGVILIYFGANRQAADVVLILSLLPVLYAIEFPAVSRIERGASFHALAKLNICKALVGVATACFFLVVEAGPVSIALGSVSSSMAGIAFVFSKYRAGLRYKFLTAGAKPVLAFFASQVAVHGANAADSKFSDLVLGYIGGIGQLGVYSRATGLNGLLWNHVQIVIGRVVLVDLTGKSDNKADLVDRYKLATEIITGFLWPAFAGLAVLADPAINILFGGQWEEAVLPLQLLCLSSMILVSVSLTWEIFVLTANTRRQMKIEFVKLFVNMPTFALACNFGLAGVAGMRIVHAVFAVILYSRGLADIIGFRWSSFIFGYAKSALSTCAAIMPATVLVFVFRAESSIPALWIVLAVTAGIACWIVATFISNHALSQFILKKIKNRV